MAQTLSKTNIVNGNTIQASDVSQSIDALTGAIAYDITISGSFTFTGATTGSGWFANAVSSSFALSSSRAVSSSYALSSSIAFSSSYAYSSSIALSSSFASSSSLALSSSFADGASQVNGQNYDNGTTVAPGNFKFIAGKNAMASGALTSSAFIVLQGRTLGTNAWITANYQTTPGAPDSIVVNSISASGQILMSSTAPLINATVLFTGIYI
jgi:hypothetical protein